MDIISEIKLAEKKSFVFRTENQSFFSWNTL